MLTFCLGIHVVVTTRWCRVDMRRAVDRLFMENPRWPNRCLVAHDQPRRGAAEERRVVKTRDQAWWEHYGNIVVYEGERDGGLLRQNDRRL